jgi:ABC-type antimicrobial peptide transport system permease subunit
MELGAQPKSVMRQVLGNVAWIVTVGLVIGATASYGAERFVNALLFNLVATDKTMVAIAAMALGIAAGVAGYLPARRASRVDPMLALREG